MSERIKCFILFSFNRTSRIVYSPEGVAYPYKSMNFKGGVYAHTMGGRGGEGNYKHQTSTSYTVQLSHVPVQGR